MWESKDQTLDISYNVAELWFLGVYGVPVPKPLDIKKWEEGKCYLLLDKIIPRLKADRMLQDLSHIALKYAQSAVHQRLTLKPNSKGENRAPVVFQYDSGGLPSMGRQAPPSCHHGGGRRFRRSGTPRRRTKCRRGRDASRHSLRHARPHCRPAGPWQPKEATSNVERVNRRSGQSHH
jgi:hypothetical protein